MADDDKPKRSWRELDAQRDRGGQREPKASRPERTSGRSARYKAALERAFASQSPPEDSRLKKLAAVRDAFGRADVTKAVDAYLKLAPWPEDLEFASAALEHEDDAIVRQALQRIEAALAAGRPKRAGTLSSRLRSLEELGENPELREIAGRLRKRL